MKVDDRYATWDAAYVLGSLSEPERREYEAHLSACAHCRAAVEELRGIPALLATIDAAEIADGDSEPPAHVLDSLLDRLRERRRRRRWLTSAAVGLAAALIAVALLFAVGPALFGEDPARPPTSSQVAMEKVSDTPINATVELTGFGWGTRIDMACTYGDWGRRDAPPQQLAMVVVGRDGSRNQIATWLGLSGATALPSANTPLQADQIAAVQLVSPESGQVLLQRRV
ncbi:anti-sigma factor family protein [Mycobacterium sp. IDR2000157661]|uniref:anti-sigma factor family protein n=1 Tax=Mycobacterium sp. IDR2000157661 TaxID=2867005 RepID=UPI001EEA0E01|nr:zf-HC2 domain-containing protein [Mycobacterium sp. IDR2000157661]ULE33845.1 zf-HC2 domain-containing protein [Mycobacterium sp. IDR2000157661]